jgi:hypothetical protein
MMERSLMDTHDTSSPTPPASRWAPLEALFSPQRCADFMYMFTIRQNGGAIYCYKHRVTRHYLNLDNDGHAYRFRPGPSEETNDYQPTPLGDAIAHALR